MKEERNIDFKRHTSPPVSKMYLLKIVFYVVMLSVMLYFMFRNDSKSVKTQEKEIREIHNITVEK